MTSENNRTATDKVNAALEIIRPYLLADGGDVTLISVEADNSVKVQLSGACDGCPFSVMTLRSGIEQAIRKQFPELKELIAVS